jgi:DNA primase
MASSTTELIKEKLDIVDFLRGYLSLQQAGKNFKVLCPFHREKTPSFMVSPERQSWHCFGCGLGGDIFGFLMRYENLEFGEALRVLAEKAGVELRRLDPAEYKYTGLLYELNSAAKEFFKRSLSLSPAAKKYLADRGLKAETVEEFEIGWAPNEREALSMEFLNSGYAPDDILRAGLALKNDRGLLSDRFRGRIMFPIHNHFGKVAGFTGRILPQFESEGIGKYINSPETPIFNKSRLLYGFSKSKNFVREAGFVFLVEGQMDMLMSWQSGVKNVVASSGTALTADHLRTLKRLTDKLVLSFDNDEAGSAAAERAIDLAEASDFGVKVAVFKEFKDPAEAAQAGIEKLSGAIEKALPAPMFYFDKYLPARGVAPDYGRREELRNLRYVLAKIKNIASPIEQGFWFKELAKKAGVEENTLLEEAERIVVAKADAGAKEDERSEGAPSDFRSHKYSRRELIGERLLCVSAARGDYGIIEDSVPYLADVHKAAFDILKSGSRSSEDKNLDELLNFILLGRGDVSSSELGELRRELIKESLKEKKQLLTTEIKQAEEAGDKARVEAASEELNNLLRSPIFES